MTTWFVSRHRGAFDWARQRQHEFDRWVPHLVLADVAPGDIVAGSLPAPTVARLCEIGASYLHLRLPYDIAPGVAMRGVELSAGDMRRMNARFEQVWACRVHASPGLALVSDDHSVLERAGK
jgi:CRISPR-associated protein Csx16